MPDNDLVKRVKSAVAADHLCVTKYVKPIEGKTDGAIVLSDLPQDYLEAYFGNNLMDVDPSFQLFKESNRIVDDEEAFANRGAGQELHDLLKRHRIRNRTHVPVQINSKTLGYITVARSERFSKTELAFLQWASNPLMDSLTQTYLGTGYAKNHGLTQSEIQCLQLASLGYSSERIATETNFSFQTVNSYFKDATRKLGASNRTEAVVCALKNGVIS